MLIRHQVADFLFGYTDITKAEFYVDDFTSRSNFIKRISKPDELLITINELQNILTLYHIPLANLGNSGIYPVSLINDVGTSIHKIDTTVDNEFVFIGPPGLDIIWYSGKHFHPDLEVDLQRLILIQDNLDYISRNYHHTGMMTAIVARMKYTAEQRDSSACAKCVKIWLEALTKYRYISSSVYAAYQKSCCKRQSLNEIIFAIKQAARDIRLSSLGRIVVYSFILNVNYLRSEIKTFDPPKLIKIKNNYNKEYFAITSTKSVVKLAPQDKTTNISCPYKHDSRRNCKTLVNLQENSTVKIISEFEVNALIGPSIQNIINQLPTELFEADLNTLHETNCPTSSKLIKIDKNKLTLGNESYLGENNG